MKPLVFLCPLVASAASCSQAPSPPGGAGAVQTPLPEIPAKDLPPRTRAKPDPAKDQYLREPVYVRISERVQPEKGEAYTPDVKVLENYLKEYVRRAGHPTAEGPEAAAYRLEGDMLAEFHSTLKVLDRVAAWKYRGSSRLALLDRQGKELENYDVPELFEENVRSEESAVLHLRRHLAKLEWDRIFSTGSVLGRQDVAALISSLASEPAEGETTTAEDVVGRLADLGFPAVPYLLEALTDNRIVRFPSAYPGLKGRSLDDLRIYHVADKALEEVFQKVSRMGLDIAPEDPKSQRLRLVIIKGWENEWRRFCKPFRSSPAARPEGKGAPAGQP